MKKNIAVIGKDALKMPCFECIVEHFVLVFILICFTAFENLDFLDLHIWYSFLMFTKRSTTIEILAKLKVKTFAEENFAKLNFVIHNPTHRNLFREKCRKRYNF